MTYKIKIVTQDDKERIYAASTQKEIIHILTQHIERMTGETTYINDESAYLF